MKIKTILVLTVAAFCSMSCDRKENGSETADFAGSYKGYTLAGCSYFQNMVSPDETVVITKNTDGTASVSFTSSTWGEFTIADAQASASGGLCTLSGSGQTQMGMGGNTSTYDCTFTAEIKSQSDARMKFEIPAVMGGMTLTFQTGEAPADLLLAGAYKGYTDADCTMFQNRYTADGQRRRNRQGRFRVLRVGKFPGCGGNGRAEGRHVHLFGQREGRHGNGRRPGNGL